MRNYGLELAIPQTVKDEFVYRSRQHAFNKLLGWGIGLLSVAITVDLIIYYTTGMIAFPILEFIAIAVSLVMFARALVNYTNEDRDILNSRYWYETEEAPISESNQTDTNTSQDTIIPQSRGNGHFILHIGLSVTQLNSIANAMLNTGTLTVNYIESLGISRQNAEKLREELSEYKLLSFDDKGRVRLTQDGERVCNRIIKA
jgi:hypothetical protein